MFPSFARRAEAASLEVLLRGVGPEEERESRPLRHIDRIPKFLLVVGLGSLAIALLLRTFVPIALGVGLLVFRVIKNKAAAGARVSNFDKDYTALLISLSASIKAGNDPLSAFSSCKQLFHPNSEMTQQLEGFARALDSGASEEEAILSFGQDIDHPDLHLFRLAFLMAREEGSSLSECLYRLAKVTRQRQSFRRKIRGAVAMQKLSAIGIAGCALLVSLIQLSANSKAFWDAAQHDTGKVLLLFGTGLIVLGVAWMFQLASRSE